MEQQIILYGSLAEQRFEEISRAFTKVKDCLEVLCTEKERLATFWVGEAGTDWMVSFDAGIGRLNEAITLCRENVRKLKRLAEELEEEEKRIKAEVEKLCRF